MFVSACDALSTQTTVNCFQKSGISTESQETAIAEDDNPFQELQDEIDDLRSVQPNLIEEDFDATTFADADVAVQPPPSGSCATSTLQPCNLATLHLHLATSCATSDAEIVTELLETEGVSDDDDYYSGEVAYEPVKCSDKSELLQVIKT